MFEHSLSVLLLQKTYWGFFVCTITRLQAVQFAGVCTSTTDLLQMGFFFFLQENNSLTFHKERKKNKGF